jgi:NADPH:quinone reductase-like Zn-dependent oxidoreductase
MSSSAATHFVTRNDPAQLARIVALVDAGDLTVDIAEAHPLAELASIHHRSETGQTRGKIIILPAMAAPALIRAAAVAAGGPGA